MSRFTESAAAFGRIAAYLAGGTVIGFATGEAVEHLPYIADMAQSLVEGLSYAGDAMTAAPPSPEDAAAYQDVDLGVVGAAVGTGVGGLYGYGTYGETLQQ